MTPRSPRVLLVDDHPQLLAQIHNLLQECGLQVVGTAADGTEVLGAIAAATARHGGVDVVVMDGRMPTMGGLEATRQVRAAHPGIAVVLYSAFVGQLGDSPRQAGVDAEVVKGAHPIELVEAVWRVGQPPAAVVTAQPLSWSA